MSAFPADTPSELLSAAAQTSLASLRARIDEIDAEVHELLIARSQIIDALVRVKKTAETGAAFRPGREASMMHALVGRHRGGLPLVTVEHVWREVISTFTWLQAHYTVFVSADDEAETRDIARFYFGFTVPFETSATPAGAIASVAASVSDLAVVRLGSATAPWWDALGLGDEPRIIGRLPFLDIEGRPVSTPAVVISRALADPVKPEVLCFAAGGLAGADVLAAAGASVIAEAGNSCVVAVDMDGDEAQTQAHLAQHLGAHIPLRGIGGYAKPIACGSSHHFP